MSQDTSKNLTIKKKIASQVLLRPRITEKAHLFISLGKYVFHVDPFATKQSVKESVEGVYGVSVNQVHMIRIPRKRRMFGRTPGWKSSIKKAIVTLKKGESIELFKGV